MFKRSRNAGAKVLIVFYLATQLFFVVNIASVAQAPLAKKGKHGKKKHKLSKKQRIAKLKADLRFLKKRAFIQKMEAKRTRSKSSTRAHSKKLNIYKKRIKTVESKLQIATASKVMIGKASWYGGGSRNYALSAAMRGFRGKKVKVVNLNNGKSVNIVVNDYGPAKWTGRVVDLSRAAFSRIGATSQGVIPRVKLYVY